MLVFEVVEKIDFAEASAVLYKTRRDAWENIGYMVNKFIEDHKTTVDITEFEIDPEQSTVCIEYVYKKSHTTQYRFYEIKARFVH
jgi:hypothetical protein